MVDRRSNGDRRVSDRRRSERLPVDCRIRLLCETIPSKILQGSLLDVSVNGVRLVLADPVAVHEKLLVEARLGSRVLCSVAVQVIWTEPESAARHIIGCESLVQLSVRQLNQLKSAATQAAAVASP